LLLIIAMGIALVAYLVLPGQPALHRSSVATAYVGVTRSGVDHRSLEHLAGGVKSAVQLFAPRHRNHSRYLCYRSHRCGLAGSYGRRFRPVFCSQEARWRYWCRSNRRIWHRQSPGLDRMLIIVVLLSISNNVSLRMFGPRRWTIQRSHYVGAGLVAFHGLVYQAIEHRRSAFVASFVVIAAAAGIMQCLGFLQRRGRLPRQRGPRSPDRRQPSRPNISAAATMTEFDSTVAYHPSTRFSILIGRVSTEDSDRVLELLDALRQQEGSPAYEVIVADRRLDRITELIRGNYPEVRLLLCATETPLPELHARALGYARSEYIVVTEDHCVPPKQWLASMLEAFEAAPEGTVAVGGPVENGVGDAALDWATFLCEYSAFVAPVPN